MEKEKIRGRGERVREWGSRTLTINDTSNDSVTEENNFYHDIVIAKRLNCDIRILRYETERKVGVISQCSLATDKE